MTTQSEDVQLFVNHVRHKKADGTLYLMPERLAWIPNGKEKITLSIKYADIKTQKISPEGKPKIQLQLVLHSGEAPTFHFANPAGTEAQLSNRNDVKELLQQLLPKFKERLSKDMIEKQRILHENPELYQLYKDLVASQIITGDEFWTQVAASRLNPESGMIKSISDLISSTSLASGKQPVGISPAFLSGIKAQTDGCNGMKYNITNDIIEAIFRTYPAVKRKHFENVPHKMTDNEFWTRFFQSHYFHRDRVFAGSSSSNQKSDFFAECARSDEISMAEAARLGVDDPFVDLTAFLDDDYVDTPGSSGHVNPDSLLPVSAAAAATKSSKSKEKEKYDTISSTMNPNQALIKRFNHHSIMVLDACLLSGKSKPAPPATPVPAASVNGKRQLNGTDAANPSPCPSSSSLASSEEVSEAEAKKQKVQEKTGLEDLSCQSLDSSEWMSVGAKPLRITSKERYMVGPEDPVRPDPVNLSEMSAKRLSAIQSQDRNIRDWKPNLLCSLNGVSALAALNELVPGGSLMLVDRSVELTLSVPLDVQKELKNIYFAGNELLRHFWSCFPVTSDKLEEKLIQMKGTLEKFKSGKLEPLKQKLAKEHYNHDVNVSSYFASGYVNDH
jgi:transcription initiation factor TFIIH subunit 1